MSRENTEVEAETLRAIICERLTDITFLMDYLALGFDGPSLTCVTVPVVLVGGKEIGWFDPGYRDELCKRIARHVVDVRIVPADSLQIDFEDGAAFRVSLKPEDYTPAGEAVRFNNQEVWWVL